MHGLREFEGADHLIVHSAQSLVAVDWPILQHAPDSLTLELGPPGLGKVLATNVTLDSAWVVEPKSKRILLAREGEFDSIDPGGRVANQKIKVTGLPRGAFASSVNPDGVHVLLVVTRVINPDFANFAVVMADLTTGQLIREATIGAGVDLELLWDAPFRTWVIGDTSRGGLWRWDGQKPALRLAAPQGTPVHAATFASSPEGVMVSALFTEKTGATGLVTGRAELDRVIWTPPVVLPGLPVLVARRHPTLARWACLAQEGTRQQVQVRDTAGKVLAETDVRPGVYLDNLLWSTFSSNLLWCSGIRALATATLSE